MEWSPYRDRSGSEFALNHLHPQLVTYRLPPTVLRPSRDALVLVTYSLHCFTRSPKTGEVVAPEAVYHRNREGRLFCQTRWEYSQDLPRIVNTILERRCFRTDRRNHVLFSSAQTEAGQEYAVFFVLKAAAEGRDWDATMMVLSAHPREGFRPRGKPSKYRELLRAVLK